METVYDITDTVPSYDSRMCTTERTGRRMSKGRFIHSDRTFLVSYYETKFRPLDSDTSSVILLPFTGVSLFQVMVSYSPLSTLLSLLQGCSVKITDILTYRIGF